MSQLQELKATLPSDWYFDPNHYFRELEAIWYRDWVCVGRQEDIPNPGDYFVAEVGTQRLIVTRNADGDPRVFHNTCRHRGSTICSIASGHFRNSRIICPYHTWTYDLDGELQATPSRVETDDFNPLNFSLYRVHIDSWGGFLFINLSDQPTNSLTDFLGEEAEVLESWPLAKMTSVHQERAVLACNWKVFWENYSECYHCPRVHPELCKVVPIYKKGLVEYEDGPPRVGDGLSTWTLDGQHAMPAMDGLDSSQQSLGMSFASFTGSMFVVGHPDYVRSVRLLPRGPESVELTVDWLLLPEIAAAYPDQIEHTVKFGRLVVEQDGQACELNQQGLKSSRHESGVLVPQEYYLWEFHEWLRRKIKNDQNQ